MALIANFVAALIAVVLPLAAVFDPLGAVLGKVFATRAGPAKVRSAGASYVGCSGSPKVGARAAAARDRIHGSIARTNLSAASAWPIGAASWQLRGDPRAKSSAT